MAANAQLKNDAREMVKNTASDFELMYNCSKGKIQIITRTSQSIKGQTAFVLPLISPNGEEVNQPQPNEITIQKPEGLVKIKANVPLKSRICHAVEPLTQLGPKAFRFG